MEDNFDTLAANTAAEALVKIQRLVPFKLGVFKLVSLNRALASALKAYRERGADPALEHDYAVAATALLAEKLPLRPPDDVREKMIGVCEEMLADFRRELRRWPCIFEPSSN